MMTLSGSVAEGRAQQAVAGATVTVKGGGSAQTDASGHFTVSAPKGLAEVNISKPGYASTRVAGLNTAETTEIDEILRPVFDQTATTAAPSMSLSVLRGDPANPKNWEPLKPGQPLETYGEDITIGVTVQAASPETNTFKTGIATLEVPGGTSGYLNAGLTRTLFGNPRDGTTSFSFKASDLALYQGKVNLHVVAYDLNNNRVHLIQPLNVLSAKNIKPAVAPEKVSPYAVTFADNLTFGPQSLQPAAREALMAQLSGLQAGVLGREDLTPLAAPEGASLWVDVRFSYPSKDLPRAFELWRSFDNLNFTKVFSSAPKQVAQGGDRFMMRDTSPQLAAGREVFYKVRAVSDAADGAAAESEAGSTTPLSRYSVQLVSPAQAQTGVSLTPTFTWTSQGASDVTRSSVIVLDRVQAEGYTRAWTSKSVVNQQSAVYNFDGAASQPQLQPNHAYEWQLASITTNKAGNAVAIAADYFNVYGLYAAKSGPVNEFVTGGGQ
ncbi:carboxypeptidase-like regulatory domain-containing protein [Deinococcus sp. Marseille-Q6407]|uniref:carboxypeptidase-like regulatory domain-containing protein n=1 Tax=Deinococcus sp. Marseille-Q6407 TaxID=2969223 RepID=UPI0021C0307D|nr:carboxypeptidase-like regulatory domain-containing protein [Deinococcus sp. Marseille-Q6407]